MSDNFKDHLDELADLIREFKLTEASLETTDFKISLKKTAPKAPQMVMSGGVVESVPVTTDEQEESYAAPVVPAPAGTPVTSPMTGIYYAASGPSAPNYVKEGDAVTAGQVIGLIEAMKVYSEIHATSSGTIKKIVAENGQMLNPGDPILYIG